MQKIFLKTYYHIINQFNKIFVFLGGGIHKIKKKAEQTSCEEALQALNNF